MNWSDEQRAIFDEVEKGQAHVVVRARAGTGKTTTILEALNVAQESDILLCAFNKSIATELARRVENQAVQVKTLHALGFRMILKHWPGTRVSEDNERATALVERIHGSAMPDGLMGIARQLHTKAREINPYADSVAEIEELAAKYDLLPDEEWDARGWPLERLAQGTLEVLRVATEPTDTIDFADMIFLPLANNWVSPTASLVLVDEAQDMSSPQLDMAQRSLRPGGRMVLVGDDRQAIYGFRGADSNALDRMKEHLDAKELGLKTTFRCPRTVVQEAQTYVPDIVAAESAPTGMVEYTTAITKPQPGAFVLSRVNAPLVTHCLELIRQGTTAIVKGRDIGRGLQKLIKKCYDRDVDAFLGNVEGWMIKEERRANRLHGGRNARLGVIYDQAATLAALAETAKHTDEVRERVDTLFTDDAVRSAVVCSTVHKAKGLESGQVWMLIDTWKYQGPEEDNLKYVAITRSKGELRYVSG